MTRTARKLFPLSMRGVGDLFRAQASILAAMWTLRRVRIGDLVTGGTRPASPIDHNEQTRSDATVSADAAHRAAELADALNKVARYGVLRPACLVRSMALRNLLSDGGIEGSVIRVGVRRDADGFIAHAWVELAGAIVGDDPVQVSRFTPLDALRVRTNS